jgi:cell division protease FtsH
MLAAAVIQAAGQAATAHHNAPVVSSGGDSFMVSLQQWLPLVFMAVILGVMVMLVRSMPRTRPEEIRPQSSPDIGWSDIAGADEAKDELREIVDYMRDPKRFRALGANVPKGVLLYGPPGTGKTLLAKAVAHESGAVFFSQSAASFVEMFVGVGAARIRRLFRAARKRAPAIVFIDELDAVGTKRGMDSREHDQTLNQLLVEMDGFDSARNVVVIAASNMLEKLDPALLRPGRFDRQIFVSPPDVKGRERILHVHTRGKPVDEAVDYVLLARQTSGLTGADLANIVNEAAINAARRNSRRIQMVDFDHALERVVAGMQSRRTLTDHERRVVAYHEAGHALCGELLETVDPVHRISIVPRGSALGYTLSLPEEDRYLKTREELIDLMTVALGGRAAEDLVFGSVTTGAGDDLRKVATIAHAMVHEFAMGNGFTSLRVEGADLSEATRRISDHEVHELADEAMRAALRILGQHRSQLDEIAATLLAKEVIEREDIRRIMSGVRPALSARGSSSRISVAAATAANPAQPGRRPEPRPQPPA